ncbi:MAG TPA: Fe-S oxidoreductase [Anaeromyxobacter sp.]|nr:Fe-S oxidoreductase [Anaeromyxobacter sp.]
MATSHHTFREELLDLAYGELGGRSARALRRHLCGCAECRAELARIEATRKAMSPLGPQPAPARGEAILLAAAREAARARRPRPLLSPFAFRASVGLLAIAVVAVVSFRLAGRGEHPPLGPSGTELVGLAAPVAPPSAPGATPSEAGGKDEAAAGAGPEKTGPATRAAGNLAPSPARAVAKAAPGREPSAPPAATGFARPPPPERDEAKERTAVADAEAERTARADLAAAPPPPAPAAEPAPPLVSSAPARAEEGPAGAEADRAGAAAKLAAPRQEIGPEGARVREKAELAGGRAGPVEEGAVARHARLRAAGRLRVTSPSAALCPGEAARELEVDEQGRVVKLTRRGTAGGSPFQVELFYGREGTLGAVRYQAGGAVRERAFGGEEATGASAAAPIPPWALEPRRAADALGENLHCGPPSP